MGLAGDLERAVSVRVDGRQPGADHSVDGELRRRETVCADVASPDVWLWAFLVVQD